MIGELEKRGLKLKIDEGINIKVSGKSYFVRCGLLGLLDGEIVVCIDFATPSATSPVKSFIESYARIRKARYAVVVAGEEVWIYDVIQKKEVGIDDLNLETESEIKAGDKDIRIAAAYYNLIHCPCGVEDEGNSLCGLPP